MNGLIKAGEIQSEDLDVLEAMFLVKAIAHGSRRQIDRKSKVFSTLLSPVHEENPCTPALKIWMCI